MLISQAHFKSVQYIDGYTQDYGISSVLTMEIPVLHMLQLAIVMYSL